MPPTRRRRALPPRERGTGSIYEEETGYRASIRLKDENGEWKVHRHRASTYEDAEHWLNSLVSRRLGSGALPQRRDRAVTVGQFANTFLASRSERIASTTLDIYRTAVDAWIIPSIGSVQLRYLQRADVVRFVDYMRTTTVRGGGTLSWNSRNIYWRVLRTILREANRDGLLAVVPMHPQDAPSKPETVAATTVRDRVLDANALQQLRAALTDPLYACTKKNHDEERCCTLWVLRLVTGLRQGEMLGLQVKDFTDLGVGKGGYFTLHQHVRRVPWEHGCKPNCGKRWGNHCPNRKAGGMVVIPGLKSDRGGSRIIGLPEAVIISLRAHVAALKEAKHADADHFLFGAGESITYPEKDRKRWEKLLDAANVKGYRLHDLRHTALSNVVNAGLPITAAQALAGHSSQRTTEGYLHPDPEATRTAVEVAAGILESHTGGYSPTEFALMEEEAVTEVEPVDASELEAPRHRARPVPVPADLGDPW